MKQLKLLLVSLIAVCGMAVALPAPALAASGSSSAADQSIANNASAKTAVCQSLNAGADCKDNPGGVNVNTIIRTIVNVLSWVVGVVAVIMIIIGGFKYITSNGDSNNVSSAKNTIMYAVIGLIVVAFAQAIVQFVIRNTTK